MGKRLLASFLAAAMMLTMAPFAFAVDDIDNDETPAAEEAVAGENQIETQSESALQQAINSAADGSTVTMSESENADITINKNITLDLNNKILTNTNAGKATITVASGATVTVQNGSVVGGKSFYNIQVAAGGTLTLEGVTATAGNNDSSMIDNLGTLTITSGTYTGGLNVVKSEPNATLTITGGTFNLESAVAWDYTGVVMNYGDAIITGGTFNQNATTPYKAYPTVVITAKENEEEPRPTTKITGGTFVNKHTNNGAKIFHNMKKAYQSDFDVSGGTFSKKVAAAYCPNYIVEKDSTTGMYSIGAKAVAVKVEAGSDYVDENYANIAQAVREATKEDTVKLLQNVTEDIKIPTRKVVNLDLNGHTLTNASGDTITVAAKGTLTIQGEGTVDNVTHGKAAIVNNGTVTLNGGTYTRSKEAGKDGNTSGGNSYYTILNDKGGNMTINSGVTVTNAGHFSSMIRNGGDESSTAKSVLTINGGTFSGGINTVKNDAYGVLTINDGNFSNTSQFVVMNWNDATINGGTFSVNKSAQAVLFSAEYDKNCAVGELIITGGTFKGTGNQTMIDTYYSAEHIGTASVSGGVFTADVKDYCAPGYKPELTNGVYVVKAGTNDAINAIDAAIKAIDDNTDDVAAKVSNAITEVDSIPNETLSSNSSTMDKLAKLDEQVKKDPAKVEVKTDDEGAGITLSEVKNAALSASTTETAKQTITINVDPVTGNTDSIVAAAKQKVTGAGENAKALDITMTKTVENGEPTKIDKPTAPVVLTFTLPTGWKNAQIVYVDGDKTELVKTTVSNDKVSGVFNHFSTYVLVETEASKNPNEYEIILTPNTYDVSAGDTLTYTVSLKHTEGNATSDNMFEFYPDTTNGLLSNGTFEPATGINAAYGPDSTTGKTKLEIDNLNLKKNDTLPIGTLSYTVQAYGQDATIGYTDSSKVTVSNKGREDEAGITMINPDVRYHVLKVTFQSHDSTSTEGYAAYGTNDIYKTLDALKTRDNNKKVNAPTLSTAKENGTGGAKYRVLDDKWYLSTDSTQTYELKGGIKTSVTFVEKWVELVKVDIPKPEDKPLVEITEQVTRTDSDGNSYVDKGANLKFKLTEDATPNPGMKYDVKVKVGGGGAFAPGGPDADGVYTVNRDKITGDVSFVLTQKLALTEEDIYIFTDTDSFTQKATYRPFSTYSGNRTLVLIKGAMGAKYQFNTTDAPTIYATDVYTTKNHYDNDYTLAVLIDSTAVTQVNKQAMLDYMINTLKLNTVTGDTEVNPTIVYDYATNGNTASKPLVHAQVARDFTQMLKGKENGWYWEPGDELLLKADVITVGDGTNGTENTYTGKPDGHVSEDDVATFMYLHVGKVLTTKP